MLAEFLDRLHGWFEEGCRTAVVDSLSTPDKVCVITPRGKPEWIAKPLPILDRKFSTLASFIAYQAESVWVSPSQVVGLLAEDFPHDRSTLPLALSPIFTTLDRIAEKRLDQKQLIDTLRISFAGADVNPSTFELAVRQVRFETTDEQTGDVTPNKADAMGRSIRAQIHAASDLPDAIDLKFLAYPSLDIDAAVTVSLAVNVDLKARTFQLIPLPGEIDRAKASAVESVRAFLAEKMRPASVFCGVP